MPREIVKVAVLRLKQIPDGALGYTDQEVPKPGSPFEASVYRRRPDYRRVETDERGPGPATLDDDRVVSFRDPLVPVEEGDTLVIPPCTHTRQREERVTVLHLRPHGRSLQCDIRSGATPSADDRNTPPPFPSI
jgi:hypothetical protein